MSMTARAWLLVGFLFVVFMSSSFAEESIPATATPNSIIPGTYKYNYSNGCASNSPGTVTNVSVDGTNGTGACTQIESLRTADYTACTSWGTMPTFTQWTPNKCNYSNGGSYALTLTCPSGSTQTNGQCVGTVYSCPANQGWTLVNQSCVRDPCPEGSTRDEYGVCQTPQTCDSPVDTVMASGYYNVGTNASNSPPPAPCINHCNTSFEGKGPYEVVINGVKNYFMQGAYYSNGSYCATNSTIVDGSTGLPSSSCGANQDQGTINGKTVCVDRDTNKPVPTDPPKETTTTENTTTNPDGSTTTTKTTNHPDGSTTTETTTTNPDGTKTTTVVKNGGESDTPADGSATEATQKEILDELKKDECESNPDRIGCMEQGTIEDDSVLPQIDLPLSFTPTMHSAGSCPAANNVNIRGWTFPIEYTPICSYASALRPFVLSFSYLSAMLIVIGARKEDS